MLGTIQESNKCEHPIPDCPYPYHKTCIQITIVKYRKNYCPQIARRYRNQKHNTDMSLHAEIK